MSRATAPAVEGAGADRVRPDGAAPPARGAGRLAPASLSAGRAATRSGEREAIILAQRGAESTAALGARELSTPASLRAVPVPVKAASPRTPRAAAIADRPAAPATELLTGAATPAGTGGGPVLLALALGIAALALPRVGRKLPSA